MISMIVFSLLVGVFFIACESWLHVDVIIPYLSQNLLTMIVAVIAINVPSISVVLTKLRDIVDDQKNINQKQAFAKTKKALLFSIQEQLFLVLFVTLLIMFSAAKGIGLPNRCFDVVHVLLVSCFVYELWILYDTAKSIFLILDYPEK